MDKYDYAKRMFISYLRRGEKQKFNVKLLQNKLRLSEEEAIDIYNKTIESVNH